MTSVSQFDRRFSLQEQLDDINACGVRGPMQTAYSVGHRVHLQTQLQQKLDHVGSAILASPRQAALHLLVRRVRFQTSVLVEEVFDQVEPSHSGRSLKIQGAPLLARCSAALPRPFPKDALTGLSLCRLAPYSSRMSMSASCTPVRNGKTLV